MKRNSRRLRTLIMVSIAAILMLLTAVPAYNAETAAAAAGRTAI